MTAREPWFRNPGSYIRQLIETYTTDVTFDRGYTSRRAIDPEKFMHVWMPPHLSHWRMLHVGDQGTAAYNADGIYAVYPTWQYGVDSMELLVWMCQNPAGEDPEPYYTDGRKDTTPVAGQSHIVVLTDLPNAASQRAFYQLVKRLEDDYPEVTFMIHGTYAFQMLFSLGWRMFDFDVFSRARNGPLYLPNGKLFEWRDARDHKAAINAVGFKTTDLKEPSERCKFQIQSLKQACTTWDLEGQARSVPEDAPPDTETPQASWKPKVVKRLPRRGDLPTDMIACDICSLASSCYVYRAGSVCTLPRSSGSELAKHFKTRDSGMIIQGLMGLMDINTERLEKGLDWEEEEGELSPEVSKLVNSLFRNGVDLAKLVDPKLGRNSPLVAIQNNVGETPVAIGNSPHQQIAQAKAELEEAGFVDLTFEMVDSYMKTGVLPNKSLPTVVDAEVVDE